MSWAPLRVGHPRGEDILIVREDLLRPNEAEKLKELIELLNYRLEAERNCCPHCGQAKPEPEAT